MNETAEDFDNRDEFSCAVFYSDQTYIYACRYVSAERAFKSFTAAIEAAKVGNGIQRVIITDGGDCTNAEWKKYEGLTYPPVEKAQ